MGAANKTVRQNANRKIVNGIQEHLSGSVTLLGVKYTPNSLAKMFQVGIDTADATDKAAKAWHLAVAAEKDNTQELSGVQAALRSYVKGIFGETTAEFADFGFKPKVVTEVDVPTKAKALVKRAATRAARGTKGKRQKEQIKGTVVDPAEPAVPATTTSAAAPAASVSGTNGASNGAAAVAPATNGGTGAH